jgi:hypothetical protein
MKTLHQGLWIPMFGFEKSSLKPTHRSMARARGRTNIRARVGAGWVDNMWQARQRQQCRHDPTRPTSQPLFRNCPKHSASSIKSPPQHGWSPRCCCRRFLPEHDLHPVRTALPGSVCKSTAFGLARCAEATSDAGALPPVPPLGLSLTCHFVMLAELIRRDFTSWNSVR